MGSSVRLSQPAGPAGLVLKETRITQLTSLSQLQKRHLTTITMRIPETWKRTIKSFSSYTYTKHNEASSVTAPPPNTSSSVHSTPAGQYPSEGPQPGKLGVIFYYLSVCLCIIGVLTMAKCTYIQESSRPEVLILGLSLVAAGLLCLNIANWIYNREHQAVVNYLKGQVEKYRQQHNRNIQGIPPESDEETV